ncbi:MAG: DUF503 domain-containing protein [Bacillota bacterium]
MVVARAEVELLLPGCKSLKDKRQVLRSILERLRGRFNLAAAEVDEQDRWNMAVIGLACVSGEPGHARGLLEEALRFLEADGRCEVLGRHLEIS